MNRKKLFIIISIITITSILGGAVWYFFIKTPSSTGPDVEFPGEGGVSKTKPGEETPAEEEEPDFVPGKTAVLPRLYELHKLPVAGVGLFEEGKGVYRSVSTRYVERGLGHIFETPLHTYKEQRIVNETRPRIAEALWGNGGRSVVVRYLDKDDAGAIITRVINIIPPLIPSTAGTSTENTVTEFNKTEEIFFPDYIPFVSTAEDNSDSLFYLENNPSSAIGTVSTYNNSGASKIFSSSFTEWLPQFPNKGLVTLTTKPSATISGNLFFVNKQTGSATKVFGEIEGLTTLTSPNGRYVLVGSTLTTSLYTVAKGEFVPLYINTLPEKCVWGKKNDNLIYCAVPRTIVPGEYPDQWYQGLISFSDDLWEIDTNTMGKRKIMSPADFGVSSFDIINPSISSDDVYLVFMNKLSGTPWLYRISEEVPPAPLPPPLVPVVSTTTSTTTKNGNTTSAKVPVMKKLK